MTANHATEDAQRRKAGERFRVSDRQMLAVAALALVIAALALAVAALALVESRRGSRYQITSHEGHLVVAARSGLYSCVPVWTNEFGDPIFNKFGGVPVGRPGRFNCNRVELVLSDAHPLESLPDVNPK